MGYQSDNPHHEQPPPLGTSSTSLPTVTTYEADGGPEKGRQLFQINRDTRVKLLNMTKQYLSIAKVYKETLRSLIAKFESYQYIDAEQKIRDVKCVYGNQERAVGRLFKDNTFTLPMISVAQTLSEEAQDRQKVEALIVHEKYWDHEKQRAIRILSLAPRPVNINYAVNLWSKYQEDMDQLTEQVRLEFNPQASVITPFSSLTKASITSETNIGTVEVPTKEERVLQKTFNIVVFGYIPNPKFLFTQTGKIEKFMFDAYVK